MGADALRQPGGSHPPPQLRRTVRVLPWDRAADPHPGRSDAKPRSRLDLNGVGMGEVTLDRNRIGIGLRTLVNVLKPGNEKAREIEWSLQRDSNALVRSIFAGSYSDTGQTAPLTPSLIRCPGRRTNGSSVGHDRVWPARQCPHSRATVSRNSRQLKWCLSS